MVGLKIKLMENSMELGKAAAAYSAKVLNSIIVEKGNARLVLSTGASQFDTLKALVNENVDWSKVEMFHLDEYVGLPETHPASFRKYLKERFVSQVNLKNAYFVSGEGDVKRNIEELTRLLRKEPIDLALIGIGENGHIAFNDPPADFDTKEAYITVNLNEDCKKQQLGEGWFKSLQDVPNKAISMTVYQIMQSKVIVSCVPHKVKAMAIKRTLENDLTNKIPATMLKTHPDCTLFIDSDSASLVDKVILDKYV
jgi:glucosamine-6-phosphate deaminase